jgi:hypothetical protein
MERWTTDTTIADPVLVTVEHPVSALACRRPVTAARSIWVSRRAVTWRIRATFPAL